MRTQVSLLARHSNSSGKNLTAWAGERVECSVLAQLFRHDAAEGNNSVCARDRSNGSYTVRVSVTQRRNTHNSTQGSNGSAVRLDAGINVVSHNELGALNATTLMQRINGSGSVAHGSNASGPTLQSLEASEPTFTASLTLTVTGHKGTSAALTTPLKTPAGHEDARGGNDAAYAAAAAAVATVLAAVVFFVTRSCRQDRAARGKLKMDMETFQLHAGKSTRSSLLKGEVLECLTDRELQSMVVGQEIAVSIGSTLFTGKWKGRAVSLKHYHINMAQQDDADALADICGRFREEVAIWRALKHPCIVECLGCTVDTRLVIILAPAARGPLAALLQRGFRPGEWPGLQETFAHDMAAGLAYLHAQQPPVLHRDVKCENVVIGVSWRAQITEFGLSRTKSLTEAGATQMMTQCGTPFWTAPEIFLGRVYNDRADVYSYGITVLEMLLDGAPVWGERTMQQVGFKVSQEGGRPQIPMEAKAHMAELIVDCWAQDASERPSMEEVRLRTLEAGATDIVDEFGFKQQPGPGPKCAPGKEPLGRRKLRGKGGRAKSADMGKAVEAGTQMARTTTDMPDRHAARANDDAGGDASQSAPFLHVDPACACPGCDAGTACWVHGEQPGS